MNEPANIGWVLMTLLLIAAGLFVLVAGVVLLLIMLRPFLMIRKSGLELTLIHYYQLQANRFPVNAYLHLAERFKKAGVTVTWPDLEWFHLSAEQELSKPEKSENKTSVNLLGEVLLAIELTAGEGYMMSFQQAVMQVLKGKNGREVAREFVQLMWMAEGKAGRP